MSWFSLNLELYCPCITFWEQCIYISNVKYSEFKRVPSYGLLVLHREIFLERGNSLSALTGQHEQKCVLLFYVNK